MSTHTSAPRQGRRRGPAGVRPTRATPRTAQWQVWSTRARVVVSDPDALEEAVARTKALLAEVDVAASRFRPDSELRTLTRRRDRDRAVRLSPLLADLIRTALRAAAETDGAVDPTIGAAVVALGYDRDIADVRAISSAGRLPALLLAGPRPAPGWRRLRLDGDTLTLPDGVDLDLGATAKARAADLVIARLADLGVGALVSIGGDIATTATAGTATAATSTASTATASETRADAPAEDGWQIGVRDPDERGEDPGAVASGARIRLSPGWAVATSSTAARSWTRDGRRVHHIVDPATGDCAAPVWRTVSVVAPDCAQANAASTAAVVLGADAPAWLHGRGLSARLVDQHGRVRRIGGWPHGDPAAGR